MNPPTRNRHLPAATVPRRAAALAAATALIAGPALAGFGHAAAAASSSVVAKDGSGNYTTVQAAVNAVPANNAGRYTITIKPGTYREIVSIPSNKPYISFVGAGSSAGA